MSERPELRRELMDDPELPVAEAERALADLERVHGWVGNGALWRQLDPHLERAPRPLLLVDVGSGSGQVAAQAAARAAARGTELTPVGVDRKLAHLLIGRRRHRQPRVVADALALPFADGAVDLAISSYFLHHFREAEGERLLAEMRRVARRAVVVADIRRSRLGGLLGRLVLTLLRLGPVAAVDGRLSLAQAWTPDEVRRLAPPGTIVDLRRRWPFRWSLELTPRTERPAPVR